MNSSANPLQGTSIAAIFGGSLILLAGMLLSPMALASMDYQDRMESLVLSPLALTALAILVLAYVVVIAEEYLHLRKSKPVILAAGLIWLMVAFSAEINHIDNKVIEEALHHNLLEYAELMLFLLVAMTYINSMTQMGVFASLRSWLITRQFSYKQLFWITGTIAFFLSPIADNLTTALLMGTVMLAVGVGQPVFVTVGCINIVVAANAGGAFSPFGDITTLMVWQAGKASFFDFFVLFLPAVVNALIPAFFLSLAVPDGRPEAVDDQGQMKRGAIRVCLLFLCTIATAVSFEQFLHLPPFMGMMTGLSYLALFSYYIQISDPVHARDDSFDIFHQVARAEWDTLLFFFGIIFCVGGMGFFGYLTLLSEFFYVDLGPTVANIIMGVLSAIIDNIPVMFAILQMNPEMNHYQWLLITLTTGVGGSLLSIGSAAGVALMGQARGVYTFFAHLKWAWAIALGYAASIWVHYLVNG